MKHIVLFWSWDTKGSGRGMQRGLFGCEIQRVLFGREIQRDPFGCGIQIVFFGRGIQRGSFGRGRQMDFSGRGIQRDFSLVVEYKGIPFGREIQRVFLWSWNTKGFLWSWNTNSFL